jgi:hypothetical protein
MTAFTKTQICNIALGLVGDQRIESFDNGTDPNAITMRDFYDLARDFTLQAHDWPFARKYKALAQTTTPVARWDYAYTLPGDYLAIGIVGDNDDLEPPVLEWEVADGKLLMNADTCYIRYTAKITAEGAFPPQFVDCMAVKLAALSAQRLSGSPNARLGLEDEFEKRLRSARATLSLQQPTRNVMRSQWTKTRFGSRAYRR